jgi:hypothetical protein
MSDVELQFQLELKVRTCKKVRTGCKSSVSKIRRYVHCNVMQIWHLKQELLKTSYTV